MPRIKRPHDMSPAERQALTAKAAIQRHARRPVLTPEAFYGEFFAAIRQGILIVRAEDGRVEKVTPHLVDQFGYGRDELVGKPLWNIGPTQGLEASREALRELLAQPGTRRDTLSLCTRAGQLRQVDVAVSEYSVDGVRMLQCCLTDVTAQRSATESTMRLNTELLAAVETSKRREREHKHLNRMNRRLYGCSTLDELFDVVALTAEALLPDLSGFLALSRLRGQRLEPVARWGTGPTPAAAFERHDCLATHTGRPFRSTTSARRSACRHLGDAGQCESLCVPLIRPQEDALGLLCVQHRDRNRAGDADRWRVVMGLADSVTLPLFNLLLRDSLRTQATVDALTGLHNRRHLDDSLVRELHRAARNESPLCIAMLDIDHFKHFNDSFGHLAGDAVLRQLAALLRDSVRKSDISCRFGGEEFLLVLPDSRLDDARLRVEQIMDHVRGMRFRDGDRVLGSLTLSAGITQSRPQDTPHALLSAADEALYAAKQAGRDRIAHPVRR